MSNLQDLQARAKENAESIVVRLSDGAEWMLRLRGKVESDPDYDALLAAVYEAEDRAEGLRAELALVIFLLTRHYPLSVDHLNALLSFEPNSPALNDLQNAVHGLVLESMSRSRAAARVREGALRAPRGPNSLRSRVLGSVRPF